MTNVILLDGATGTELNRRGVSTRLPLWSTEALLTTAGRQTLQTIHADYVAAGANILTANTFRLHTRNLISSGLAERAEELIELAVSAAQSVASPAVQVAGSLAPLEDCYSPELVPTAGELEVEHTETAIRLAAAGVDLILVETMNTIREAQAAAGAATATGLPVYVSFTCGVDGRLLSAESVTDAVHAVLPFKPFALLINCLPADAVLKPLQELIAAAEGLPVGVYANIGRCDPVAGWENTDAVNPTVYAEYTKSWIAAGACIIGGCCGTTPEHIGLLKQLVEG